ncbi:MAG: ABC transporter ATP-binding protein [Bacillota bacterium]
MIEIKEVYLAYNNLNKDTYLEALQDISLSIDKGERCVLIGPSGCGKSSLLFLLAGLVKPSKGQLSINGGEVKGPREEIALILQDHGLFPWKTVQENAELGLMIRGVPKADRKQKVYSLLRSLGIEEHNHKYPAQLSGGQRQRVAITRALAQEPQILLMDEPFSALDALTREQLQELVLEIWRERLLTLVMVTHNIEEAVFLGGKIIILSSQPGRIIKIINNTASGVDAFRESKEFYDLCSYVRSVLEGEK